jgi:hypothetical protein
LRYYADPWIIGCYVVLALLLSAFSALLGCFLLAVLVISLHFHREGLQAWIVGGGSWTSFGPLSIRRETKNLGSVLRVDLLSLSRQQSTLGMELKYRPLFVLIRSSHG